MFVWQQSLGYVPQDIYLMDTSILENIAMGIPKELINYSQVEKCAKMAQVHNFINKELPSGYKTIVEKEVYVFLVVNVNV